MVSFSNVSFNLLTLEGKGDINNNNVILILTFV